MYIPTFILLQTLFCIHVCSLLNINAMQLEKFENESTYCYLTDII